ncbi:LapA family protein [Kocuria tytonicola]|uniref:LapA family protein n=1 Tax=Kocuria tytonicola TaxID=2055946 RepID=UPI001FB3AC65|nr:lipopolysaccharide assembly protein LapA domain-containing protein [Kocuria tytonicola]
MSNTPHDRPAAARETAASDAGGVRPDTGAVPVSNPQTGHLGDAPGEPARSASPAAAGHDDAAVRPGADTHPDAGGRAPRGTAAAETVDPALDAPAKRGVSGTVWAALIAGVVVLILLLVFILQNNVPAHFEYMAWSFNLPLGVAMLLSAIAGALIMALVGSVRMFGLSRRLHKLEKERERIRHTLGS